MKTRARLFTGLSALAFVIPFVIFIIQCGNSLADLRSATGSIASYAKGSLTFELFMAVAIIISCGATLLMISQFASDRALYISTSVTLTFIVALLIADTFISFEMLRKMFGDLVKIPGIGIAKLVFLFLSALLIFIGDCFRWSYYHEEKSNWFLIGSLVCIFIVCIFAFTAMDSTTSGLNIAFTILLVFSIFVCMLEYLNNYIGAPRRKKPISKPAVAQTGKELKVKEEVPVYQEPVIVEEPLIQPVAQSPKAATPLKNDSVDPASELRKLKSLYDDGVITSEEYNEKRKKYVDKL